MDNNKMPDKIEPEEQPLTIEIPGYLHTAILQFTSWHTTTEEYIFKAIEDKLRDDILLYKGIAKDAEAALNAYTGKRLRDAANG